MKLDSKAEMPQGVRRVPDSWLANVVRPGNRAAGRDETVTSCNMDTANGTIRGRRVGPLKNLYYGQVVAVQTKMLRTEGTSGLRCSVPLAIFFNDIGRLSFAGTRALWVDALNLRRLAD